jgi:hypothetical protein
LDETASSLWMFYCLFSVMVTLYVTCCAGTSLGKSQSDLAVKLASITLAFVCYTVPSMAINQIGIKRLDE